MQGKAISLIHSHAQTVLQKSVATLQAELSAAAGAPAPAEQAASGNATAPPAGAQPAAALLCVRFRALAEPQLAPVLEELAKRTAQAEYRRLLSNIEASFCAERSALILPFVRQHIAAIQKAEGLHEVARCARCPVCPLRAQDMDRCSDRGRLCRHTTGAAACGCLNVCCTDTLARAAACVLLWLLLAVQLI